MRQRRHGQEHPGNLSQKPDPQMRPDTHLQPTHEGLSRREEITVSQRPYRVPQPEDDKGNQRNQHRRVKEPKNSLQTRNIYNVVEILGLAPRGRRRERNR